MHCVVGAPGGVKINTKAVQHYFVGFADSKRQIRSCLANLTLRLSVYILTCSVCSMAFGKFLRVQMGMDFSGGS